jgi:hypothetical protein
MFSEKLIKKIDKQWAASKAVIFDWKKASDEEAAYMMVLHIKDRDKVQLDPDLVLKCIRVIRHGKFAEPKYSISSRWGLGSTDTVVGGKTYTVNLNTRFEYEGESYKFKDFGDFERGFGILGKDISFTMQNCLSAIVFEAMPLHKLAHSNLAERLKREAENFVTAQLHNSPPKPVVVDEGKVAAKMIAIIEKAFTGDNRKRLDVIEGLAFLMQTDSGDSEIQEFLTALRRNPATVKELTPEIFQKVRQHFA